MNIRTEISDYHENKDKIEKWLSVKGEHKYCEFVELLKVHHAPITWAALSGLYRYDKRLLFNNFKYISFFEEYLRSIIIEHSIDKKKTYKQVNQALLSKLIDRLLLLDTLVLEKYFTTENLLANLSLICTLRNKVAHSRIIIKYKDYKLAILAFYGLLPIDYKDNYKNDILKCTIGLLLPNQYNKAFFTN